MTDTILRNLAMATSTDQQLKTGRSDFGFRKAAINAGWTQ